MKIGASRLSRAFAMVLLASCDRSSLEVPTAPPSPSVPVTSMTGSYAGTATIRGIGSHDPGGDCVADAVLRASGQTWSFNLDLVGSVNGTGRFSTPLVGPIECSFRYYTDSKELALHLDGGCELTYGGWELAAGCSPAETIMAPILMTIPRPAENVSTQVITISGPASLDFERSPYPSFDLDVVLQIDLQRL